MTALRIFILGVLVGCDLGPRQKCVDGNLYYRGDDVWILREYDQCLSDKALKHEGD